MRDGEATRRADRELARVEARGRALHGIPKVAIEDIHDLRQYIGGIIARRWAQLPPDEQDELALEGIAIVYELHRHKWDPARCPSFASYCSTYLPLKLIMHWRREMRVRTGYNKFDGSYETVASLDALSGDAVAPAEGRGRKKGITEREAA